MIPGAVLVLAFMAASFAPGLLLARGTKLGTGQVAAVCAASLAVALMATALTGIGLNAVSGHALPAWAFLPISLLLSAGAYTLTRGKPWQRPEIEWPGIAVAALFCLHGALAYHLSVGDLPDGSLRVHAWYNADWFKHLGHVHGLADYGIPAKDIFASGRPLHYYWLLYILPGGVTALGGDAWAALYTLNLVIVFLLGLTMYGIVRQCGPKPVLAAVVSALSVLVLTNYSFWIALFAGYSPDQIMRAAIAPSGPALLGFALYIPQHALALALLLGWALVTLPEGERPPAIRWLAVAGLITLLTLSTLLGAALLACYGIVELLRHRHRAVPELALAAVLSAGFLLLLGVIKLGDPTATMQSPLMIDPALEGSPLALGMRSVMIVVKELGIPFFLALWIWIKWQPADRAGRDWRILAATFYGVALLFAFAAEAGASARIAHEMRIRVLNLPALSIAMLAGWALSVAWARGGRERVAAIGVLVLLSALSLPSTVLRTAWHGIALDHFTTIIPADDRAVLEELRRHSDPQAIVWQYPEKPYLSDVPGDDSWSAILAGRTNVTSERATDYGAAHADLLLAYDYFDGKDVAVPAAADWVYLSRKLHPESYDALRLKLDADPLWRERACYPDACAFSRADSSAPQP